MYYSIFIINDTFGVFSYIPIVLIVIILIIFYERNK